MRVFVTACVEKKKKKQYEGKKNLQIIKGEKYAASTETFLASSLFYEHAICLNFFIENISFCYIIYADLAEWCTQVVEWCAKVDLCEWVDDAMLNTAWSWTARLSFCNCRQ